MRIAGAILAGGEASRFNNRPKGLMEVPGGGTIIGRLLEEMARAGLDPRVICANDKRLYAGVGAPVVPDLNMGNGPLGGIEAGLHHFTNRVDAVLFLPCDTPKITAREIKKLCGQFRRDGRGILVAETGDGRWHPLCSILPVEMYDKIALAVRRGHLSVKRLWRELGAASVRFENSGPFANVNSPEDFAAVLRAPATASNDPITKKSKLEREGEAMPVTINIPETMHDEIKEFLAKENIAVTVASDAKCDVSVVPGEERRESSVSSLHPGGWIKCPVAWAVSDKLSISYGEMGKILNFYEIKIRDCALGCF